MWDMFKKNYYLDTYKGILKGNHFQMRRECAGNKMSSNKECTQINKL